MAQQEQAQSLGEVVGLMQRKASEAEAAAAVAEAPAEAPGSGFFIAPRVRFSDRLWTKLGGKAREAAVRAGVWEGRTSTIGLVRRR